MNPTRVLLIEDDRDMIEDFPGAAALYGLNVTPLPIKSLPDFLKTFAAGAFDAIVLDLRMPPLDNMTAAETENGRLTGVLVCRWIRKLDPNIPILVFTAMCDSNASEQVRREGANEVISKPKQVSEIAEQVKLLARKR